MDLYYRSGDTVHTVVVESEDGGYRVVVGDRVYRAELRHASDGRLDVTVNGRAVRVHLAREGARRHVQVAGTAPCELERVSSTGSVRSARGVPERTLSASTPAQVVSVLVSEGDSVAPGDTLVVLEAMKMEFRITAPSEGTVARVGCRVGEVVERGQVLVEMR